MSISLCPRQQLVLFKTLIFFFFSVIPVSFIVILWVSVSRNSNSHMDDRKEVLKLIIKSAKLPKPRGVLAEVLRRKYSSPKLGVIFLFKSVTALY